MSKLFYTSLFLIKDYSPYATAACASYCNNRLQFAKINVFGFSQYKTLQSARCTSHAPSVLFRSSVVSGPQFNLLLLVIIAGPNLKSVFILWTYILTYITTTGNDILANVSSGGKKEERKSLTYLFMYYLKGELKKLQ